LAWQDKLFAPERDYRINPHSATRGEVTGDERHQRQQNGDGAECQRVMRGYAEKLIGHELG
jgi:hypothetical protein